VLTPFFPLVFPCLSDHSRGDQRVEEPALLLPLFGPLLRALRRLQVLFCLSEGAYVRVTRPYLILTYRHPVYVTDASRYLHLYFTPSPTPTRALRNPLSHSALNPSLRTKPYPM